MPILETNYWVGYYRDTVDPTATESDPPVYTGLPNFLEFWWNQSSGDVFMCPDNTLNAMRWDKIITSNNLSSQLNSLGFSLPSSQSYTDVSLAFSTNRTPSTTKNTFVVVNVSQTSVLLGSATVNVLVGGTQIASAGLSGVAATQINSISFMVAPTDVYQITQTVTGIGASNSIVSIKEFYL